MYLITFKNLLIAGLLFFSPLAAAQKIFTLQEALKQVKENNLQLKTMLYELQMAKADEITAGLRPNLNLNNQSLQLLRKSELAPGVPFHSHYNRQMWWQLTKDFQTGNKRVHKLEFAARNVAVTQKNILVFERELLNETAGKWLGLWESKVNLTLIHNLKYHLDSVRQLTEEKHQQVAEIDQLRFEVLAGQYSIDEQRALQEFRSRAAELRFLLNVTDSIDISSLGFIGNRTPFKMLIERPLDTLISDALRYRADLALAQAAAGAAQSNIRLQKSLAFPDIEFGFVYNPQNSVPYGGVYVNLPLPVCDRNQGEIQKSVLLGQQSKNSLEQVRSRLIMEVSLAFQEYQNRRQNLQRAEKLLDQSYRILEIARSQSLKGEMPVHEWIEEKELFYEQFLNYNEVLISLKRSELQLLYVTGLIHEAEEF